MFGDYVKALSKIAQQGDATEESYYSVLKHLIEAFAETSGHAQVHVTVLPKKTEAGNPDFRVWDGKQHIVGYIEAKNPALHDLDAVETSEQLKRYLYTFPNLILTNFCEFRLYRYGKLIDAVDIAPPFFLYEPRSTSHAANEADIHDFLEKFLGFVLPKAYSAKSLAVELASRTRYLKEQILDELERDEGKGTIRGFYEAFQKFLIGTLTKDAFADLYGQTITYGLFAARTRAKNGFNRKLAYDLIPRTIGILRDVFHFISLGELPPQMEWIVDDIAEVLSIADIDKILKDRKGRDPIVHFYEPFLAEYDPKERERRGVYYTPEPVVSYIVGSLHRILKQIFHRPDGFASGSVRVLDPAAGTCTFPAEAARQAVDEFSAKYGEGGKTKLIPDHVLKNFYAFELMMAPYAVGHLKIGYLLEELGYPLEKDQRFRLYLTNTLDMQELQETKLPGMSSLAEESHLAGVVKRETPILVILGNPPYSGHSANIGEWISHVIRDYYVVDGKPLGEKNPKWLQDDYVKFIRFGQWKIEQAGEGVLGFITNHSYLDNPTFRGMRQSLMNTFDQIYLLDLHGNSLRKERCPDSSEDKNVFDIRQGVAIGLFVKKAGLKKNVHHAEIWGIREKKYDWLEEHDISTTQWTEIHPKSPLYFFVPRDETLLDRYQHYPNLIDIFPVNSVGIVTSRDEFVIDSDKETLKHRIRMFRNTNLSDEMIRQKFGLRDKKGWRLADIRRAVIEDRDWEEKIVQLLYRPFDVRWIFYHDDIIERSRRQVMQHMLSPNVALVTPRRVEIAGAWQHALVSGVLVEHVAVSLKTIDYVFPLHLYPAPADKSLLSIDQTANITANLNPKLLQVLNKAYGRKPSAEEMFRYVYAILHSPAYCRKYVEFLKTDFARIPLPQHKHLFAKIAALGKRLVDLHLLQCPDLDKPISRFQGKGDNRVEKQDYSRNERRVYINKTQYFEGVEPHIWSYQVGAYKVLDKWLKDRKNRLLTIDDIKHYCRVVTALAKTVEIQTEIDTIYSQIEATAIGLLIESN